MKLLAHEPPAFQELTQGESPFVILVDHASRRIPEALGSLGLSEVDLGRHIAWDIGALGLARALLHRLGGTLIAQNYSRLVVDCNRPMNAPGLFAEVSEDTVIPGNVALSEAERAARLEAIFWPYHRAIEAELMRREREHLASHLLLVHSFTPVYRGVTRKLHAGILYGKDARWASPMLEALRKVPGLEVGDNEPYSVSEESDYAAIVYGERAGRLYLELEVRQDLIESPRGQEEWAERLSAAILSSLRKVAN